MEKNNKRLLPFLLLVLWTPFSWGQQGFYFPERGTKWETIQPADAGFLATEIAASVEFAQSNEYSGDRDLRRAILKGFAHEPYHEILGPTKKRGGPAGMILYRGHLLASWGDIQRVDMTFSVTKSYLSTVAGLAIQNGLIQDVHDPVGNYVWDGTFDGAHNAKITWDHLLTQTSDWSGSLWGGADWADRPPKEGGIDDWKFRDLNEPGSVFEYNDVRVNVLAYSLLQVWRKPLPQVLKEQIMDPIGASSTWRWFGYDNSWTNVDGQYVQSVSGGGHSGGGIFINTEDHARFGLLFLNGGNWNGRQLIDPAWIEQATQGASAVSRYGYMWWLNVPGERYWEGVPEDVFYAAGFGGNFIVVVPSEELVIVTRWLEPKEIGTFVQQVLEAKE
ncbi:MAG: serine hydrolase [Bacteroidota bacterium]